jgi:toxin FitB
VNRYLLDTNVISELRKPRPHGAVAAWFASVEEETLFLSALTLGELQAGIEKTRHQYPRKATELENWVDWLPSSYQVLSMDTVCFREWARIMNGKPQELLEDAMIAATARVYRLVVVTRNEKHFNQFDVKSFNPFKD